MSGMFEDRSETLRFNIDSSNLITFAKYGPRTFSTPSADSSPHPPGCRYDRPGTAFRDPIPASVSYFWVALAWSSRRNWCLEVVHFACSFLSTSPPYSPNVYLPSAYAPNPYLFISLAGRGLKTALENHLYDGSFGSETHHFSNRLFFFTLRNFHDPFSLSSMRSLTYQLLVSANLESLSHLPRVFSQIDPFTMYLFERECPNEVFCQFICVPLAILELLSVKSISNILWGVFFFL